MEKTFHLIVGLGITGRATAQFLAKRGLSFCVFDTRSSPEGIHEFKQLFPDAPLYLGSLPCQIYDKIHTIIASPGVPLEHPVLLKAQMLQIPIIGDIECLARVIQVPVIAITGTNGKSTVTALVGEMAKAAGKKTAVAGNIGDPVLTRLDDGVDYDVWVLELSSFQLELVYSLAPQAATILNVTPDHLDRHHHIEAYVAAKQRIYHQAKQVVFNREDSATRIAASSSQAACFSFGLSSPQTATDWGIITKAGRTYLAQGSTALLPVDEMILKGQHNWQNALAACALAQSINIELKIMQQVLKTFTGLPHRCQWVRTLEGVDWINDSKGTNIGAAISAIRGIGSGIEGKIILIAGGLGKGADFAELRSEVAQYVRSTVLLGKDAPQIAAAIKDICFTRSVNTLDDAIKQARQQAQPGDVVLLSPACASQDMFRDYAHRGEQFSQLVNRL